MGPVRAGGAAMLLDSLLYDEPARGVAPSSAGGAPPGTERRPGDADADVPVR